jgi:hypothetical protein
MSCEDELDLLERECEDIPDLIEGSEDGSDAGGDDDDERRQIQTSASRWIPKKAVVHRRVRLDMVMAAKACQQNAWVGMLLSKYDWAENGVLELARQIQSEYWSLGSYSRRSSSPSPRPTSSCTSGWAPHERAAEGRWGNRRAAPNL